MAPTPCFLILPLSCSFQELSAFPRAVGGSGAGLHPVVYPCTALLLLCLFSTIITYILNHRWELLKEGKMQRGGCGSEYWPVSLPQVGLHDVCRLFRRVKPSLPSGLDHIHKRACTQISAFPLCSPNGLETARA